MYWDQGTRTWQKITVQMLWDWLHRKAEPCVICGTPTKHMRSHPDNGLEAICAPHEAGLGCLEVWRNRIHRADLPSYGRWLDLNYNNIGFDGCSDNEHDYDVLEVPWQDERDSYHDYKTYIQSREWNVKSWEAKRAVNWTCQRCGFRGQYNTLNTHHLTYKNLYHELKQDVEVLCIPCHQKEHSNGSKKQ